MGFFQRLRKYEWTPGYIRGLASISAVVIGFCLTHDAYGEKGERAPGSQGNRPEPMVFDLVDPLGAPKGKLEVNTLLDYSPRSGQVEWSPEVEYSFAKGHAIEFELPLENTTRQEYKVSLQGTFGHLAKGRMLHGWQAIGRRKIEEKVYAAELLYVNDYRFSNQWSTMNMIGARHTAIGKSGELIVLMNNSLFYSFSEHFILGVELNTEIGKHDWRYRLTPQIQYVAGKGVSIQLGGGPSQLNETSKTEWLLTSRVIYDF
jgi:hypothetical protein